MSVTRIIFWFLSSLILAVHLGGCSGDKSTEPLAPAVTDGSQNKDKVASVPDVPKEPTSFQVALEGTSSVRIGFTYDDSDTIDSCEILRTVPGNNAEKTTPLSKGTKTYLDSEVTGGTTYEYRARCRNQSGPGAATEKRTVTIPTPKPVVVVTLNVPANVTAKPSANGNVIEWTDNSQGETGYIIAGARGTGRLEDLVTLDAGSTTWTHADALAGVLYSYTVRAVSGSMSMTASAIVTATIPATPPVAPSELSVVKKDDPQNLIALIKWKDNSNNEKSFIAQRAPKVSGAEPAEADFKDVCTVNENIKECSDSSIVLGEYYWYRVIAAGESNRSTPSDKVSFGTSVDVVKPTRPSLKAELSEESPTSSVKLIFSTLDANIGSFIISMKIGDGAYKGVATPSGEMRSFKLDGLTPDTTYSFIIVALNSAGTSDDSMEAIVRTKPNTTKPLKPTNFTAAANDLKKNLLQWDRYYNASVYFVIQGRIQGEVNYLSLFPKEQLGGAVEKIEHLEVIPNTTYEYRMKTVDTAGLESDWVETHVRSKAEGVTPVEVLSTPSELVAVPDGDAISLAWSNVDNDVTYEVFKGLDGVSYTKVGPASNKKFSDPAIVKGTPYFYYVRSVKGGNKFSDPSNSATAIINDRKLDAPTNFKVVSDSPNKVNISWSASAVSQVKAVLTKSTDNGSSATKIYEDMGTSFEDTDVSPHRYTYTLLFTKADYNSSPEVTQSIEVKAAVCTTCPAPVSITEYGRSSKGKTIKIKWTIPKNAKVDSYIAEYSTDNITFTKLGKEVNQKGKSLTKKDCDPTKTYYFRIATSSAGGVSTNVPVRVGVSVSKPKVPTGLAAALSGGKGPVILTVSAGPDTESFDVKRRPTKGAWVVTSIQCTLVNPEQEGAYVCTDPTAVSGKSYEYTVCAVNSTGKSSFTKASNTVAVP